MTTVDDGVWSTHVRTTVDSAVGVTWDGCHKIYLLMDATSCEYMEGNGYEVHYRAGCCSADMFDAVRGWWDDSCRLRFVDAIESSGDLDGGPVRTYWSIIGQDF